MPMTVGPPPPGGNRNRAGEIYAFTWVLQIISIIFVAGRMYSRIQLTRNAWWDDWCICVALVSGFVISVIWSVYAGRGYARHLYYLTPDQLSDALELNFISRSLCIFSIAIGKASVAFLIERIAPHGNWRKWMLRSISISVMVSAIITILLFYVQCRPARALWDQRMIKAGIGKCWNPIPVNIWDLVIASYWTFLDFALAVIPVDIVWKLQLNKSKKFLLSLLLSMGIFAGIAAAVKTSKIPITVHAKSDITWQTVELLMWNGIEMNVIVIAACIPTLRPLCLLIFNHPSASQYGRPSLGRQRPSYRKQPNSHGSSSNQSNIPFTPTDGRYLKKNTTIKTRVVERKHNNSMVGDDSIVLVKEPEAGGRDDEGEERDIDCEWGHTNEITVPLKTISPMKGERRNR